MTSAFAQSSLTVIYARGFFSSKEKRKALSKSEKAQIVDIDNSLSEHSLIPEDIQFFVTTSRNKEGINIKNKDYHHMFIETHMMYDAVQMAGRVRQGVDNLYIISNSDQLVNGVDTMDVLFSQKVMVENNRAFESENIANKYLIQSYPVTDIKAREKRREQIRHYVKYIEKRFPYVRYNVFNEAFEFFSIKEKAEKSELAQQEAFEKILLADDNEYISCWFPNSAIGHELSIKERAKNYLKDIIDSNKFVKLTKEEMKRHTSFIAKMFTSPLTSYKPILHLVDENFNCIQTGQDYILFYGTEDPRIKPRHMGKQKKH